MFDTTTNENNLSAAEAASSSARVFSDLIDAQATARASYVQEIKLRVQNGSYRPNLLVVAERLLGDLRSPNKP